MTRISFPMKAQHDMSPSTLASLEYSLIFLSLAFGIRSLERGGEFHATVLACFLVVPHVVCNDKPLVDLVHSWVLWVLSTHGIPRVAPKATCCPLICMKPLWRVLTGADTFKTHGSTLSHVLGMPLIARLLTQTSVPPIFSG